MAEKKIDPVVKLPTEMTKKLMEAEGDIDRAAKGLEVLESLGMDVKELREKLEWSKNVRTTLLKEFG